MDPDGSGKSWRGADVKRIGHDRLGLHMSVTFGILLFVQWKPWELPSRPQHSSRQSYAPLEISVSGQARSCQAPSKFQASEFRALRVACFFMRHRDAILHSPSFIPFVMPLGWVARLMVR
mmetsp:Transcript_36205/g.96178  ORF Transcript_36205/g.96178 Transcript_36205/m.96178 type:complete len:120 (-) Transcript_36205:32-391(-)